MSDITQLLDAVERGDGQAASRLISMVYDQLRQLAQAQFARERLGHSLDTTGLVHEAYLRLINPREPQHFENHRHFFAVAAEAMRRILVDWARQRHNLKRGGGRRRVAFNDLAVAADEAPEEFLDLHEALEQLEAIDRRKAELVKLRFFAGMTQAQAALALGISTSTADNDWAYARCWLRQQLGEMDKN